MQTILVVDDDPQIRRLVAAMLAKIGYHVLSADTGENALRLLDSAPDIHLLLTDVVAPGMSGPMIAEQVAALRPDIKVLFMTGYDGTRIVQRFVIDKGYSLIVKPFTMHQLASCIRKILGAGTKSMTSNSIPDN